MTSDQTPEDFLVLGHISRAHGVHGAVVVTSYTEVPESLLEADHLELLSPDGRIRRPAEFLKGKAASQGLIVKLKNVSSREAAMALKGWRLGLKREYLPAAEDDEVYLADLVGLEVKLNDGRAVGRIQGLIEAGGGLILSVTAAGQPEKELLLPFHEEFVVKLDLDGGELIMNPPEGLLDI